MRKPFAANTFSLLQTVQVPLSKQQTSASEDLSLHQSLSWPTSNFFTEKTKPILRSTTSNPHDFPISYSADHKTSWTQALWRPTISINSIYQDTSQFVFSKIDLQNLNPAQRTQLSLKIRSICLELQQLESDSICTATKYHRILNLSNSLHDFESSFYNAVRSLRNIYKKSDSEKALQGLIQLKLLLQHLFQSNTPTSETFDYHQMAKRLKDFLRGKVKYQVTTRRNRSHKSKAWRTIEDPFEKLKIALETDQKIDSKRYSHHPVIDEHTERVKSLGAWLQNLKTQSEQEKTYYDQHSTITPKQMSELVGIMLGYFSTQRLFEFDSLVEKIKSLDIPAQKKATTLFHLYRILIYYPGINKMKFALRRLLYSFDVFADIREPIHALSANWFNRHKGIPSDEGTFLELEMLDFFENLPGVRVISMGQVEEFEDENGSDKQEIDLVIEVLSEDQNHPPVIIDIEIKSNNHTKMAQLKRYRRLSKNRGAVMVITAKQRGPLPGLVVFDAHSEALSLIHISSDNLEVLSAEFLRKQHEIFRGLLEVNAH